MAYVFGRRAKIVAQALLLCLAAKAAGTQPSLARCGAADRSASASAPTPVRWSSIASRVERYVLPDTGTHPVLSIRSLELLPNRRLLFVDSRARTVSVRDQTGRWLLTLGRSGEGPGEYRLPISATVDPAGQVWVADIELSRIIGYSIDGRFIRTISNAPVNTRVIVSVRDSLLLSLGAVVRDNRTGTVATLIDQSGAVRWSSVPLDPRLVELGLIVDHAWGARVSPDLAVVGMAAVPGITLVDTRSGAGVCHTELHVRDWKQLAQAEKPAKPTLQSMRRWLEATSSIRRAVALPGGGVVIESMSPTRREEQGVTWTVFDPSLVPRWEIVDAPGSLMAVSGDTAWLVSEDDEGRSVLVVARVRWPSAPATPR